MSQRDPGVIVVADDDADILDLVTLTLERAGHVVHCAPDGEQALELVRQERPDVAVLDVAMPKLDGFELARQLRSDPGTSEVQIVPLTARVQERDTDADRAAGANEYIRKPFSPQELQKRVAALPPPGSCVTGKVLIVEDDPDIARLVGLKLKQQGL
jgi:DNA-binding response OmpR family regulator